MKRVLLIDDNDEMLSVVRDALKKPTYQVDLCSDPFQTHEALAGNPYSLIICDVKMPGVSGLVLIDELQRQGNQTPVLFITGENSEETAREALRLRTHGIIEKPFRLSELRDRVRKIIG